MNEILTPAEAVELRRLVHKATGGDVLLPGNGDTAGWITELACAVGPLYSQLLHQRREKLPITKRNS